MVSEVKQRAPEAAYLMRLVRPPRIHRGVVEADEVLMSLSRPAHDFGRVDAILT